MKPQRYQCLIVIACIAFIFTLTIRANLAEGEQSNISGGESRPDVITIDSLKSFGALEREKVTFLHDAHTAALEKNNKSCDTCHLTGDVSGKAGLSLKFKRSEDKSRQEVMDIYHTNCMACHKEMSNAGNKSGPVEACGECHKKDTGIISSRKPIKFDKSLHYQHIEFNDQNCSVCHHEGKKAGSCRYCHKDEDSKEAISLKAASHLSCIGCHREMSGPGKCNECHDINEQQKIVKSEDVPRLTQGQPDVVLLGADLQADNTVKPRTKMNPVPFDHKAHEQYQESCIECHHAEETGSCMKSCHTVNGSEKGKMITAEKAMHDIDSKRSCVGCHDINKKNKDCAGCHAFMSKFLNNKDESCLKCHKPPVIGKEKTIEPEMYKNLTADQLKSSDLSDSSYADNEIPEKVIIKNLSKEYGPVNFPHRKIVKALVNNIKDNKLAGYFHSPSGTICQGCHHNSPLSKEPPQCSNCHAETEDVKSPLKPGIKGAYHLQCIGCHNKMKITKVDGCTKCHEEKKAEVTNGLN